MRHLKDVVSTEFVATPEKLLEIAEGKREIK
jgi:hypothetical protein